MERFLRIDRRIIFAIITVAVIVSLILRFELPIPPSEPVQGVYEKIESLPKGSHVMIAFDYDPSSKEELQPMAIAFLHHCFSRDLKVIGMTHYTGAPGLADQAMTSVANQYQKRMEKITPFWVTNPALPHSLLIWEKIFTPHFQKIFTEMIRQPYPSYRELTH